MKEKPNVVLFTMSGTPKPGRRPDKLKNLPKFKRLSNAEKKGIAQRAPGLPKLAQATLTPFLTLTVDHMQDPLGYLNLHWPERVFFPLAHYVSYNDFLQNYDEECNNRLVKQECVEIHFQVQPNRIYMVDFFVAVDNAPAWFQVEMCGVTSDPQQASAGGNHLLTTPVYIPQLAPRFPGGYWCAAFLRPSPPKGETEMAAAGGPWYFVAAEVTKFENV
ncbi:MAG TPA: hypothetical protein VFB23_10665 [Candidatus Acidoferrales bacterium]|nr:hypothetical protein [Candidatus Acidoferrales bacterium]